MNTQVKRNIFLGFVVVAIFITASLSVFRGVAQANPSYFVNSAPLTAATSSPIFMVVGTAATSTLTFNSAVGTTQALNSATLLTQFTGSSTAAVLTVSFEVSQDGIDWYSDDILGGAISTTTLAVNISGTSATTYTWKYASSTIGGATSTQNMNPKALVAPTPLRLVRAVYTITGANGAVWGQFVGKRENN